VEAGAARMLIEANLTPNLLLETLTAMLTDRQGLQRMSPLARRLAHADASERIGSMVVELADTPHPPR